MDITKSDLVGQPTNFKDAVWEGANIDGLKNISGAAYLPGAKHLAIHEHTAPKVGLIDKLMNLIPGVAPKPVLHTEDVIAQETKVGFVDKVQQSQKDTTNTQSL